MFKWKKKSTIFLRTKVSNLDSVTHELNSFKRKFKVHEQENLMPREMWRKKSTDTDKTIVFQIYSNRNFFLSILIDASAIENVFVEFYFHLRALKNVHR